MELFNSLNNTLSIYLVHLKNYNAFPGLFEYIYDVTRQATFNYRVVQSMYAIMIALVGDRPDFFTQQALDYLFCLGGRIDLANP